MAVWRHQRRHSKGEASTVAESSNITVTETVFSEQIFFHFPCPVLHLLLWRGFPILRGLMALGNHQPPRLHVPSKGVLYLAEPLFTAERLSGFVTLNRHLDEDEI